MPRTQRRGAGRSESQTGLARHHQHTAEFWRRQILGVKHRRGLDGHGAGAVAYLVGRPGEGLHCMFHMMNEARIDVGIAATMLGMAGYYASLDYAKNRPQGRRVGAGGQRRIAAASAHHQTRGRQVHAVGAKVLLRRCAGVGVVLCPSGR